MCLQCHQGISDKDMIESLQALKEIKSGEFVRWNTTSVSHIRLSALGINCPETRKLAIYIFKQFIEWRKIKPAYYMPPMGLEKMPSVAELEQDYFYIMMSTPDYSDKESIYKNYMEYKESHKIIESDKISDICSIQ